MPELPEVETTLRGLMPHIHGQTLVACHAAVPRLRQDIPQDLAHVCASQRLVALRRRAKYLVWDLENGISVFMHLGMSGRMVIAGTADPDLAYEHVRWDFANGASIRLRDPRRFGLVLHTQTSRLMEHPLFANLGPEPLEDAFDVAYLKDQMARRRAPVKSVLMDANVVVGIGNIYANEALFRSGIHPATPAADVSGARIPKLWEQIRAVLSEAIEAGGSSLRDYAGADGKLGYFSTQFQVYGRKGEPCLVCGSEVHKITLGQRGTYYCPVCQQPEGQTVECKDGSKKTA